MSDAVKAFVESVRSRAGANPAARVRVQSFTAVYDHPCGMRALSAVEYADGPIGRVPGERP